MPSGVQEGLLACAKYDHSRIDIRLSVATMGGTYARTADRQMDRSEGHGAAPARGAMVYRRAAFASEAFLANRALGIAAGAGAGCGVVGAARGWISAVYRQPARGQGGDS